MERTSATLEVEDRLFRALAVLRGVLLVNTIGLTVFRWQNFDHPHAGAVAVAAVSVWTVAVVWLCADRRTRYGWLLLVDLAVAVAGLLASPWLKGESFNASILGFWIAGPLLACAVRWHLRGGLAAGVLLGVVDLSVRDHITQTNYGNVFLLVVAGVVVGHMTASVEEMAEDRAVAERAAAAAGERARLARAVHDGVLQVLALVQRRGAEAGGAWAELSEAAGAQEAALRGLIRHTPTDGVPEAGSESGSAPLVDLTVALERFASPHVTVVTPGQPVLLPTRLADELVAAVGEALTNVRKHVGATAPAWLLVDLEDPADDTDGVEVLCLTVRDEGPGIPAGRLESAARAGRLGVAGSIRGRVEELGGTVVLDTSPHGTEWEFRLPLGDR